MEQPLRPAKDKHVSKNLIKNVLVLVLVFVGGAAAGYKGLPYLRDLHNPKSVQKQDLPDHLDYSGVEEVYKNLKTNFDGQLDKNKLEDGLKEGLVKAAGDPYTEYLNAEDSKDFNEGLTGSFEGIGAELGKDKDLIVIISPLSGYPAEKAGLKPKDAIVEINGENASDLNISDAVKKIRGPKGTKVKLSVLRDGKKLDFDITRDEIKIPSVTSEVVSGNIGVIKISRFGDDTVDLATKYAQDLKNKHVKGVILDLRGDPGGLLDAAVGVSDLWLKKSSVILQEKRGGKVEKTYFADGNNILGGMPTVVLIDEGSASASEITAGALHDNNVAKIIGQKSYGKGSVQQVLKLDFGGEVKVTIARWYTPDGRNIDKEGIEPDQKVKLSDADIAAKRDPQKDAAIQYLQK